MASSSSSSSCVHFSPLILTLFISIIISLFSPSHSAISCDSPKLPSNRTYANCTKLPHLGATLHFTYNATNRSFAIAFSAEPPKSGWVAWGINTQGGGMVGAQALLAYEGKNDVVSVHPYNLTSYKGIDQVKSLSFETWDLKAEESDDVITIFAAFKLPEKADNLSQIWQVGPMTSGKPMMHAIQPENLQSRLPLQLVGSTIVGTGNTTGGGGGSGNTTTTGGDKSGGAYVMGKRFGLGFYFGLVLVLMGFLTM